jgi:hypothetical protein
MIVPPVPRVQQLLGAVVVSMLQRDLDGQTEVAINGVIWT